GDITKWSTQAPLSPPEWIRSQLPLLTTAFGHAAAGDVALARAAIASLADVRMRDWCVEHGQVSGRVRHRVLGYPPPPRMSPGVGPRNPDRALETAVLE